MGGLEGDNNTAQDPTLHPAARQGAVVSGLPEDTAEALSGRAGENESASTSQDTQTLAAGEEVELDIAPPLSPKLVSSLFNYLQSIPETKVLHTRGTWEKGVVITIMMDKPAPLVRMLSQMGTVQPVTTPPDRDPLPKAKIGALLSKNKGKVRRFRMSLSEGQP